MSAPRAELVSTLDDPGPGEPFDDLYQDEIYPEPAWCSCPCGCGAKLAGGACEEFDRCPMCEEGCPP